MNVPAPRFSARVMLALAAAVFATMLVPAVALGVAADAFEPDLDPPQATVLPVDQTSAQDRSMEPFDMDWARIDVQAGTSYEFCAITRPGLPSTPLRLNLWSWNGVVFTPLTATTLTGFPNSGVNTLAYTAPESGPVYLQIQAEDFANSGSYWLTAYTAGQPWFIDTYESDDFSPYAGAFLMAGDPPVSRSFDLPTDLDRVMVAAFEPGEYEISTAFSSLGAPPDTLIEVWDDSGTTLLATNDDASDGGPLSRVTRLTVTEPTSWQVRVSAAKGASMGAYTVAAQKVETSQGRVFGTVTGPDGAFAANALVELLDVDQSVWRSTHSASDGTFEFTGVPFETPFRVRAQIEGAGLVSAEWPDDRHVVNPDPSTCPALDPGAPEMGFNLQVRRPWVSGWVYADEVPFPMLAGMDVTVYDVGGNVLGTGTTSLSGNFFISLAPFTTGDCKVEISDPAGIRRTTWWYTAPDAESSQAASIPTFGGLSFLMPLGPTTTRDVSFDLGDVHVAFDEVTAPGDVTATPSEPQHLPTVGRRHVPGRYFDIHPTLSFSGEATVTIAIPAEEAASAASIRLMHWENGAWRDITTHVDPAGTSVSGRTSSFSDFSLQADAEELDADSSTPAIELGVLALVGVALVLLRRRSAT